MELQKPFGVAMENYTIPKTKLKSRDEVDKVIIFLNSIKPLFNK